MFPKSKLKSLIIQLNFPTSIKLRSIIESDNLIRKKAIAQFIFKMFFTQVYATFKWTLSKHIMKKHLF